LQHSLKKENLSLQHCVSNLETEKIQLTEQLKKTEQERSSVSSSLDEVTSVAEQLRCELADARAQLDSERAAHGAACERLQTAAAAKDRELDANTGTIARLMADLRAESDARARADAAAAAARRQHDAERDAARHAELQLRDALARLERSVEDKDREIGAQMTIILDMRTEKHCKLVHLRCGDLCQFGIGSQERLQERIQGMQNTIDNIQKELTGRLAAPKLAAEECEPPELDEAPVSRRADDPVFGFLSDGSVDGDALDVSVICSSTVQRVSWVLADIEGRSALAYPFPILPSASCLCYCEVEYLHSQLTSEPPLSLSRTVNRCARWGAGSRRCAAAAGCGPRSRAISKVTGQERVETELWGRAAAGETCACMAPSRWAGELGGAVVLAGVAAVLGGGGTSSPP
ncbi:hypothetical protein HF086_005408, partial [Spodoptera exigua]